MNKRKDSNPYVTRGRLKFRLCQILINAVALLAIAGKRATNGYLSAWTFLFLSEMHDVCDCVYIERTMIVISQED